MNAAKLLLLLITAALFTIMVSLGLSLKPGELLELRRRPWLILRVLLGSCVLLPLLALGLLLLAPAGTLSAPGRLAIALMALAPSAPMTLRRSALKGGDPELTAVLQVGAALAAILTLPLLADLYSHLLKVQGWDVRPGPVAAQIAQVQLLPLGIGLGLRLLKPAWAARMAKPFGRLAGVLQLLVVLVVLALALPHLLPFLAANLSTALAMAVMAAVALLLGLSLAGSVPRERITAAIVTSMRNPGLAMLLAASHVPELQGAKLAILSYVLITLLVSVLFLRLTATRDGVST